MPKKKIEAEAIKEEPKEEPAKIIFNQEKVEAKAAQLQSGIGANPGGDWKCLREAVQVGPIAVAMFWNRKDGEVKIYSSKFFE